MSDRARAAEPRGLRGALAHLGAALIGLLRTRLELIAVEAGETRAHATEQLVLILVAALAFALGLIAASALIVVLCWETNRIAAVACLAIVYVVVGVAALWRLSTKRQSAPPPFAATLAELERDRAWLAEELKQGK